MVLEYYKVDERYQRVKPFECPHNNGVVCTMKNCTSCGWHPNVASVRLDKIRKDMGSKNG
jgi:hypothetical protein